MDELTVAIERRSSRGMPRGATDVLERARDRVTRQRRRRQLSIVAVCVVAATAAVVSVVARDGRDDARLIAGPGETVGSRVQGPVLVWYEDGGFTVAEAETDKHVFRTAAPGAGCSTCRMVQIGNHVLSAADGVYRLSLAEGRVERIADGDQILSAGDPNSVLVVDDKRLSRIDVDGHLIGGPWTLPAGYRLTDPPRATASGLLLEQTGDTGSWGRQLAEWKPDSPAAPVQLTIFTRLIDVRESSSGAVTTAWMNADCTGSSCDYSIVIDGRIRVRPPAGTVGFIGGGAISPDGSTLAAFAMTDERGREARLVLVDLSANTVSAPVGGSSIRYGEDYGYATWSTDGATVYFGGIDDPMHRFRLGEPGAEPLPLPWSYNMLVATASLTNVPATTVRTAPAAAPTTLSQVAPCPAPRLQPGSNPATDFVDFVRLNGIMYLNSSTRSASLPDEILGPQIASVCQSMLTRAYAGPAVDGDAAYLPEGAPIYRVKGYDQRFRVAARRDGRIIVFEAFDNPAAMAGRDLIDLSQVRTMTVVVTDSRDQTVGRVDDRRSIERLIELLHQAPVRITEPSQTGLMYWLEFQLADGTSLKLGFMIDHGELQRGIQVPDEFTNIIKAALR